MRKMKLGLIVGIMVLSVHGAFGDPAAGGNDKPAGAVEKPNDKSEAESNPASKPQFNLLNPKYRPDKGVLVSKKKPVKPTEAPSKQE